MAGLPGTTMDFSTLANMGLTDPGGLAGYLSNAGIAPPANSGAAAPAGGSGLGSLMSGLTGVKPAAALPAPIYSGGIAGAQDAPKPGTIEGAGLQNTNNLIAAGLKNRAAVPSLGELIAQGGIHA